MLIVGGGPVLSFDRDYTVIDNGAVVIKDKKIKELGKTERIREKYPEVEFHHTHGGVIMPGMINTHMHFYSTFARGMDLKTDEPPQDFVDILEKLWWRLDYRLNEEDIYYSTISALIDSIKRGTTTIFDHHASFGSIDGSLDIVARAVKESGLRANLCYEISDRHGQEKSRAALRENERFIKNISDKDRDWLGGTLGLHASFTLKDETLKDISELRDKLEVPIHVHTAEGWADVAHSREKGYEGVVERLDDYDLWSEGALAIHGVHLQQGEMEILKENKVNLIHNPQSNMGNAVGAAPVSRALAKDLQLGLGTDGYTTDMFESMGVASILQSHEQAHPSAGMAETERMALINNKKIASSFFNKKLGVLEPGASADIIVLDYDSPTPITADNVVAHVLMGMSGDQVKTTIARGKVLMENREVKILDNEKIYRKCREQARDFWQRF